MPVPSPLALANAWARLRPERAALDRHLREGAWKAVSKRVDEVLLGEVLDLADQQVSEMQQAAQLLRERRTGGQD